MYMSTRALSDYEKQQRITEYCKNLGNYNPNSNYGQMANQSGCNGKGSAAMPLSKTSKGLNTSTNTTAITSRMRYSQRVAAYGTTQSSTSFAKKTCSLGGPTFSY